MLKLNVPVALGVPEISPVLAFKLKLVGKLPTLLAYEYGLEPPLAVTVSEYDTPIVPPVSAPAPGVSVIVGHIVITSIVFEFVLVPPELTARTL